MITKQTTLFGEDECDAAWEDFVKDEIAQCPGDLDSPDYRRRIIARAFAEYPQFQTFAGKIAASARSGIPAEAFQREVKAAFVELCRDPKVIVFETMARGYRNVIKPIKEAQGNEKSPHHVWEPPSRTV